MREASALRKTHNQFGGISDSPLPIGGSLEPGNSGVEASCGHGSSWGVFGAPPPRAAMQEAAVQASQVPLLFRQRGLSVWNHNMPMRPYMKGILFSARLY